MLGSSYISRTCVSHSGTKCCIYIEMIEERMHTPTRGQRFNHIYNTCDYSISCVNGIPPLLHFARKLSGLVEEPNFYSETLIF